MNSTFDLSLDDLRDIAIDLKLKIEGGLESEGSEIKCLPTFVSPSFNYKNKFVYVIDLGGSHLRTASVSTFKNKLTIFDGPIELKIPWERDEVFPKEKFLKIQAEALASLKLEKKGPIGYCFSFPSESLPNRDAKLIHWTKGIVVPDIESKEVGKLLLSYLRKQGFRMFERITVINDTIATLFSGLSKSKVDGYIGLIVGTGTNMATFFDLENIPKITKISDWEGSIPVNLESGNFNPPHLTEIDKEVDIHSENPGAHRFEKAISGLYLGRIFKTIFPDSAFDPDSGARGLVEIINNAERKQSNYIFTALKIYERSARLVSASIAGLIALLSKYRGIE